MKRLALALCALALLVAAGFLLLRSGRQARVEDLASSDPEVVVEAARRFYVDGVRGVDVGPELARGLSHPSARVRSRCVRTLARLGLRSYTGEIVPLLEDPDEAVRIQAAVALRSMPTWEDPAPLVRALQDPRQPERVRIDLAHALAERRETAAEVPLERLARDPGSSIRVRQEALVALASFGSLSRVGLLVGVLDDPSVDPRLREGAARGLGTLRDARSRAALGRALARGEEDVAVRVQSARSLAAQGQRGEAPRLQAVARDDRQPLLLRMAAARGVYDLGAPLPGRAELLRAGLEDPAPEVRLEAALLARRLGATEVYPDLEAAWKREQSRRVRRALRGALRQLETDDQVDPDNGLRGP